MKHKYKTITLIIKIKSIYYRERESHGPLVPTLYTYIVRSIEFISMIIFFN